MYNIGFQYMKQKKYNREHYIINGQEKARYGVGQLQTRYEFQMSFEFE
jgi:hypothetical protein